MHPLSISMLITWAMVMSSLYLCSGKQVDVLWKCSKSIHSGREEWRFSTQWYCGDQWSKDGVQWGKEDDGHADVFICHSGKQKNFARQLHRDLATEHVSCFFDELSLPIGEKFPPLIFEAAERCKVAVVVVSKEFIRSKWPMLELSTFISALNSGKNAKLKLLPIFFKISPKELSHITKDCPEWKKLEESNDIRGKWEDALKEVRSIKGLCYSEDENEVDFRDKLVKGILCLLQRERLVNQSQSLKFFKAPFRSRL